MSSALVGPKNLICSEFNFCELRREINCTCIQTQDEFTFLGLKFKFKGIVIFKGQPVLQHYCDPLNLYMSVPDMSNLK